MIRHLLFGLALAVQIAILAWAPVDKIVIRETGRVITLRTRPVDPYDVLRGYYVTLDFEIAEPPGLDETEFEKGRKGYTILAEGKDGVWSALRCGRERPDHPVEGEVVIRGRGDRHGGTIIYGIEKYFVPEAVREEIEEAIEDEEERILVDVAVDAGGDAAVLRLRIGDAVYEY